jgi:MFS family permease
MQFALSTLRLLRFGQGKADLAMGRSSLGAGLAIAISPLLLGYLADLFGIVNAFLFVPVLVISAFVIVLLLPSSTALKERV